jgi:spore germination cell wall hydrolase CwlJ-like protein
MFEAGNEPREGQMAVVQSVMTRAFSAPYPDTVCKVVYQNNGKVAQYSWTFENKDHTLPGSPKLDELVRISMEGIKKGPNGLTNYFAWRLVNPEWGRTGECARTTTRIGGHQFCTINGRAERSVASYLRAEGLPPSEAPQNNPQTAR